MGATCQVISRSGYFFVGVGFPRSLILGEFSRNQHPSLVPWISACDNRIECGRRFMFFGVGEPVLAFVVIAAGRNPPFDRRASRWGLEPGRDTGSFCGANLIGFSTNHFPP